MDKKLLELIDNLHYDAIYEQAIEDDIQYTADKKIARMNSAMKKLRDITEKKRALREEEKQARLSIQTDVTAGISAEEKAQFSQEANDRLEKLNVARKNILVNARIQLRANKDEAKILRAQIELFGYRVKNTLRKTRQFLFSGDELTFKREGITDIIVNTANPDWSKKLNAELKKQGIGLDGDRTGACIVYTAQQELKARQASAEMENAEMENAEMENAEMENAEMENAETENPAILTGTKA